MPLDISQQLPEIYRLLHASQLHNCLIDIICFIRYIAKRVSDAYATDDSNDLDSELLENNVKEAYNPELSGKAYYFTKSGGRIRDIPVYKLNEEKEVNLCRKNYVQVAKSGMTYLFLWFDPKHYGHCYGFHVMPTSEGRKDPFASAYSYLPVALKKSSTISAASWKITL